MSKFNNAIEQVLGNRKNSILKSTEVLIYINQLIASFKNLEKINFELLNHQYVEEYTLKTIRELQFAFPLILRALEEEQKIWLNLNKRFSRTTINIGVVGRQRQGKSTFLQNVTNLSNAEIPARTGQPCTSVQSLIYHSKNEKRAEVHYYSELEFIEQVIKPYHDKLSKEPEFGLNGMPNSLDEIEQLHLDSPHTIQSVNTVARGWYDSFYNICLNISDYKNQVLNREVKNITIEEIQDMVQYQYSGDNNVSSYNFVGIKKVIIFCEFNNKNVYKLGLIDLPGLGDTRLGDDNRLIRALGEDVDLMLFIKYPTKVNAAWEDVDHELYQTANFILKDSLPLDKWAFIIVNEDSDNKQMCEELVKKISSIPEIDFAKSKIANVKNSSDAESVLDIAIDYLSENITNLDNLLITNCWFKLSILNDEVSKILLKASKLTSSSNIESKFDKKYKDFFEEFRNALIDFREELEEKHDEKDFVIEIKKIIQNAKDAVEFPTKTEFERVSKAELTEYTLYHQLVHHVRSHVLKNFHGFTSKQQDKINQRKEKLAEILSSPKLLGELKIKSNKNGIDFLHYLRELLQETPNFDNSGILEGFDFICRFKISYESSIQELIYSILVNFFPDKIQKLNNSLDLTEFYAKSNDILSVRFPDDNDELEIGKIYDEQARQKSLAYVEKNTKDLIQICISVIGLFPGAELVTNVYDISRSIVNILASEKNEQLKQFETKEEIKRLKSTLYNAETGTANSLGSQNEPVDNLKYTLNYVLDMCQEELIYSLGSSTNKISTSMTKEFFDHIAYNLESEFEWKEFLRSIREHVWKDFEKDNSLNAKIAEWNHAVDTTKKIALKK